MVKGGGALGSNEDLLVEGITWSCDILSSDSAAMSDGRECVNNREMSLSIVNGEEEKLCVFGGKRGWRFKGRVVWYLYAF